MANIVPIPKHNKNIDKGTSYRIISLLSVITNILEKSILPYITANIPITPTQHGYKTQHSTVTALQLGQTAVKRSSQQYAITVVSCLHWSHASPCLSTSIRCDIQGHWSGYLCPMFYPWSTMCLPICLEAHPKLAYSYPKIRRAMWFTQKTSWTEESLLYFLIYFYFNGNGRSLYISCFLAFLHRLHFVYGFIL